MEKLDKNKEPNLINKFSAKILSSFVIGHPEYCTIPECLIPKGIDPISKCSLDMDQINSISDQEEKNNPIQFFFFAGKL